MTEQQVTAIEIVDEGEAGRFRPEAGDHRRIVTIDNRDNGETIHLRTSTTEIVGAVIDTMYNQFRLTREPDDRLTCRSGGTDVYQYSALTLAEYVTQGHCPDLHWSFVGGTGGA